MSISWFDLTLLALFLIIVVKVTLTGFVTEFFSKAAVIVGTIGAVLFYKRLSTHIVRLLGDDGFPELIAFLLLFLLIYLAVKIVQHFAGNMFEGETMTNLDRALGFFLGLAEGALAVIVILIAVRGQTWFDISGIAGQSVLMGFASPYLAGGTQPLQGLLPEFLR